MEPQKIEPGMGCETEPACRRRLVGSGGKEKIHWIPDRVFLKV